MCFIMKRQKLCCNFHLVLVAAKYANMIKIVSFFRSLWGKESELSAEIDKLKTEAIKAEKSLDHATPGVSNSSLYQVLICRIRLSRFHE